jgi:glutamyl-tRNA synthetase
MTKKEVRTRFAPSPTGYLHVGNLRGALYSYIYAKQNNGKFILRIEDTDQARQVEGAVESLIKTFDAVNIRFDEGPLLENGKIVEIGDYGPYTQSNRLDLYKKYAQELLDSDNAYYCFCTSERLDLMREEQQKEKKQTRYDQTCRNLSKEEVAERLKNEKAVIRFKTPISEIIKAIDLVKGEVDFNSDDTDDFVILKSDSFPTYHLAHIVDDYLMKISHIIRGDEWFPSLPKHLLMWKAFGWEAPEYAHLALLLNTDKSKLSKRRGNVVVENYLKVGYLPEALLNFVALLGWNPGDGSEQEIFSMEELIKNFDIKKVNKSGAVFNIEKLDWMNGCYIRKINTELLVEKCMPFIVQGVIDKKIDYSIKENLELIKRLVAVEQGRLKTLSDISENFDFFLNDNFDYDQNKLIWKKSDQESCLKNLKLSLDLLGQIDDVYFDIENLEKRFKEMISANNLGVGDVLWPFRYALTGKDKSPNPFEVAWVIGKDKSIERVQRAIGKLK